MLKAAYVAAWAQVEATPQAWFESEACRELSRSRGWEKLHADSGVAAGGAKAAQVGGGAEEEEEEGAAAAQTAGTAAAKLPAAPRKYDKANAALMSLCNVWGHKWAQDGSRCGWNTALHLEEKVWEVLHHLLPLSTASRHLAPEKRHYENKGGVRSQPDLADRCTVVVILSICQCNHFHHFSLSENMARCVLTCKKSVGLFSETTFSEDTATTV